MKYDSNSHIKSTEDVKAFFRFIVNDLKVNFHPDESFDQYINLKTNEPSFTVDECALYDRLMSESFVVCRKVNEDCIYEIANEIMP